MKYIYLLLLLFSSLPGVIPEYAAELLPKEALAGPLQWEAVDGGATNKNYFLKTCEGKYFVRVASSGRDSLGACWEREDASTTLAATLGLAPPLIAKDLQRGVMIFPFIPSKLVDLKDSDSLENAVCLIRRLHQSGVVCSKTSDPEQLIQDLLQHNLSLDPEIEALLEKRPKISLNDLVPCHLDLHSGNILDDGSRLWLIDWEYGGMSDPLFDLAILSSTEFFDDERMKAMLSLYKPDYTAQDFERLLVFRILADLRWGLWAEVQKSHSSLDVDYQTMANSYFSQAKKRLNQ